MGDLLLVYVEADDVVKANREFAASRTPFDLWFKETALAGTGVDFNQPLPDGMSEVLFETPMAGYTQSLAIALPIVPGKTEDFRRWAKDQNGIHRAEFADFMHRAGISRACAYLVHTPQGDMAIQYSEGDNPAGAYQYFAASPHPFDKWNRQQLAALHGVDFGQPMPRLPELGYDCRTSDASNEMRDSAAQGRRTDQGARAANP